MLIKGTVFFGVSPGEKVGPHSLSYQTIWIIQPIHRHNFAGSTTAFFWRYRINLYDVLREEATPDAHSR